VPCFDHFGIKFLYFSNSIFRWFFNDFLVPFLTIFYNPEGIRGVTFSDIFRDIFRPRFWHRFWVDFWWILDARGYLFGAKNALFGPFFGIHCGFLLGRCWTSSAPEPRILHNFGLIFYNFDVILVKFWNNLLVFILKTFQLIPLFHYVFFFGTLVQSFCHQFCMFFFSLSFPHLSCWCLHVVFIIFALTFGLGFHWFGEPFWHHFRPVLNFSSLNCLIFFVLF